jgi:hypothetical protein
MSGDMAAPHYRHFIIIFKNKPTRIVEQKLNKLASPKVDHAPSIAYFHELMTLIASQMIESKHQLDGINKELSDRQLEIERLRAEKQAIIDRCRPYLRLLNLNPKKLIKHRTK